MWKELIKNFWILNENAKLYVKMIIVQDPKLFDELCFKTMEHHDLHMS